LIQELQEKIESNFAGTVIDIETIGDFSQTYKYDSRRCLDVKQAILGYINRAELHIYCARSMAGVERLKLMTAEIVAGLEKPLYAFNCSFESSVWFHHAGIKIDFDGELQAEHFERKKDTVARLGISNYNDPFFDVGYMCMKAWSKQDYSKAIAHNRACLLKERDILLKRGHTRAEAVKFVK
jgi:hypothetical protein